jgi:hypothetical protein
MQEGYLDVGRPDQRLQWYGARPLAGASLWDTQLMSLWHTVHAGQQSQYIGNAQAYLQAYVASLLSAKDAAPSLLPVLVYEGPQPPEKFVDWVKSHGAVVLNHNLTIRPQLIHAAQNPKVAHTRSLWGSYLRMEPHLIMDKLVPNIINSKGERFLAQVDTKYILWTDPDVVFYKNIDSCTIPKPHILSVGPDASKDGTGNCGVIYYNLKSYRWAAPRHLMCALPRHCHCNLPHCMNAGFCTRRWFGSAIARAGPSTLLIRTL